MTKSSYLHLSHNVSNLVYHFVCPAKYRRIVISDAVDECIRQTCAVIELRYEWIEFLEIGTDKDYVHFLIQSTLDHTSSEEYHCPTRVCRTPGSKETVIGWRVLERRIFCVYCRKKYE